MKLYKSNISSLILIGLGVGMYTFIILNFIFPFNNNSRIKILPLYFLTLCIYFEINFLMMIPMPEPLFHSSLEKKQSYSFDSQIYLIVLAVSKFLVHKVCQCCR